MQLQFKVILLIIHTEQISVITLNTRLCHKTNQNRVQRDQYGKIMKNRTCWPKTKDIKFC